MNNLRDPSEFKLSADLMNCIGNQTEFTNLCDLCHHKKFFVDETIVKKEKCSLGCLDRFYFHHLQEEYYPGIDFTIFKTQKNTSLKLL